MLKIQIWNIQTCNFEFLWDTCGNSNVILLPLTHSFRFHPKHNEFWLLDEIVLLFI